jgi:hypothetical protein
MYTTNGTMKIQERELLAMALVGYGMELNEIKLKISALQSMLRENGTGRLRVADVPAPIKLRYPKGRKPFSETAKRKMAEAQKRRWARYHAAQKKEAA